MPKHSVKDWQTERSSVERELRAATKQELPQAQKVGAQRATSVTCHQCTCRRKDRARLIVSRDAEKEFDRIQHRPWYKHPKHGDVLLSHFSRVRLCATPWTAAHQAPRPWDSPGKNTGVGCHFLLQCRKVKSESEVAQSCPTLSDPMDGSLPGKSTGVGRHCLLLNTGIGPNRGHL